MNNLQNKISVIIPTLNAGNIIEKLIFSLKNQTIYPFEIIIVDSSSDDNTVEIAKKNGCIVHVIKKEEFNHGGTRRFAAEIATGEILVYLTQDIIIENNTTVEKLINGLKTDKLIACTYGRQISKRDASLIERYTRNFNYPEKSVLKSKHTIDEIGIKAAFCSNSFAAYRKECLLEVGNFPHQIIFGEDMFIAAKLILSGYKVYYNAEATVYHSHNYTLKQRFRRNFNIGAFHSNEKWILENFKSANKEGMVYIFQISKILLKIKPLYTIKFILIICLRYFAYFLGKNYKYFSIKDVT